MLAVSDQATDVIEGILAGSEMPERAGVRLSREPGADDADLGIRLELVEGPAPGDESLDGAPVFVEPEAALLLDDKLLDAEVAGDEVRFSVRPQ